MLWVLLSGEIWFCWGFGINGGLGSCLCFYMKALNIPNKQIASKSLVFKIAGIWSMNQALSKIYVNFIYTGKNASNIIMECDLMDNGSK